MEVAVIIPTFERQELLTRAVKSVMAQEKPVAQILVVNDGPSPITLPEDPRLLVLETSKRQGPTIARALAMTKLNSNINAVCYLDDDDELLPNHISLLSATLKSGFAFSKAIYKFPNGVQTEDPEPNNNGPKRYYDPRALLHQNIAPVSSFIHTVEAYHEIGGWDTTLLRMEDWDFWARMYIRYGPPDFVNEVTNVIYKGLDSNRTDSNQFVYSLACSWRDIVDDRLRAMSADLRYKVTEDDLKKFHIPRVAVVMPVFNAQKYLRQAIDSILAQTYTDFEIIAINDGSTDSSQAILEEYTRKTPKVRYFNTYFNSGVTKALNLGLLMSRSEYVARMDADDVSSPDRFEHQVKFLDENKDVMVVGTDFLSMNEDLTKINWTNDVPKSPEDIKKALLETCCIGHPTVMLRRRIIEMVGGYDESQECLAVEDYELWLRISQRFKLANLPKSLLLHREYDNQVSKKLSSTQKKNFEKVREKYRKLRSDHGSQ